MPEIRPFRGIRYDEHKVGTLTKVYTPPYDVISPAQQAGYYEVNPYNFIRLELGKDQAGDNAKHNKYTRAGSFLRDWLKKGIVRREPKEALYICVQDYPESGKTMRRVGFLAIMKIDPKSVLKHENTLAKPKKDRFALMREVRANLSPIFGLFEDKSAEVTKLLSLNLNRQPEVDVTVDGVRHRLYVETRDNIIAKIVRSIRSKPMYIADGHHRFEVACQFRDWARKRNKKRNGDGSWNYVMTYFADAIHNPFKIFPTHRLLRKPKSLKDPLKALGEKFKVEPADSLKSVLKKLDAFRADTPDKGYNFGVYAKQIGFHILTLQPKWVSRVGKSAVDALDVAVLHKMIIAPTFKIKKIAKSESIDFTRSAEEAVGRVNRGEFDLAFFLRPTSLKEMIDISKRGLKMPQKSTYFYPKLLSGVVFNHFEDFQNA